MELINNNIKISKIEKSRIEDVDFGNIPFGRVFSDHMLLAKVDQEKWMQPEILPYGKIEILPCITALHYGQSIFEGLKAYRSPEGETLLFRPEDNYNRLNFSANRMCMPEVPKDIFMDGLYELVRLDSQWVPDRKGTSLYIRPFYFATDEYIGIRPSDKYKFIIFTCPVGAYYPEPVNLLVADEYVRAVKGGTGEAKVAGNYAASLLAAKEARDKGYHNILWLDALEHRYVEESGTMNVCFVIDGVAITPELNGSILHGITRDSVITLLKHKNIPIEVRPISIDEIWEAYQNGKLEEAFGMGTAATIAHVNKIGYKGQDMQLPPISERKIGPALLKTLSDIRTGKTEDPFGWVVNLGK